MVINVSRILIEFEAILIVLLKDILGNFFLLYSTLLVNPFYYSSSKFSCQEPFRCREEEEEIDNLREGVSQLKVEGESANANSNSPSVVEAELLKEKKKNKG